MKKALIILRVSDEKQEERNSLDKQEEQALDYCKFKGYTVFKILKTVVSGRKIDRKDFLELEDEIEKNTFDVLVFYELSRLARNAYFIHKLVHSLKQKEIEFESITESFLNSDSPTSKIMLGIMASQAEVESDMISKRVRNRMKFYATQGYHLFPAPLGYDVKEKILYPNNEAEKVKNIYKDFIEGFSINKLSIKYGISTTGIKNVLTNVTYIGKIKFGFEGKNANTGKRVKNLPGEIFEGKHEAILDLEMFHSAQTIMENKYYSVTRRNRENENILTGIISHKCGRLYGKKTIDGYRLYSCRKCNKSISANGIEKIVIDAIKSYCRKLDFLKEKANVTEDTSNKKKMKALNQKKKRIVETYSDGYISRVDYLEKIKNIDAELKKLSSYDKEKPKMEFTLKEKLLKDLKEIDNKEYLEKAHLIQLFVESVILDEEGNPEITFKF
ncbi:MAG: recombinase family protein [Fusobacteriaceae bacterium]|nr:recombinase family protein [Fusobacteriaceae bacterium]MBN2839152.1 recombinase family protein [Fusobacteriaceae bacterium]